VSTVQPERGVGLLGAIDRWPVRRVALALFGALMLLFHANTTVLEEGDAVPSVIMPLALLDYGTPSFDPDRWPEMFKWKAEPPFVPTDDFFFRHWTVRFGEQTAAAWRRDGKLSFVGPRYYVVEAPARPGRYVSTFGLIPGLVALPITAVLHAIDPRLDERFVLRLSIAKLHGSLMVAGVAVVLFLTAIQFVTRRRALLLAIAYGAGTCAFAISSQSLWQQTVNQLLLALGAYFLLSRALSLRQAALAGFFFGAAAACRTTSVIVLVAVATYLVLKERRRFVWFVLGSLPLPIVVAIYNQYYFGSPLSFGQEIVGHVVAIEKTGSPELWQTPLHVGARGLLFSPSRGMLILSPFLALSFWGMARSLVRRPIPPLIPLVAASVVMMGLQCRWFDWWGGWAYGYRPWLDVVPFLVLFMIPILEDVLRRAFLRRAFAGALMWSLFVQGLGALAYDRSWNLRLLYVIRLPNRARPMGIPDEREARDLASRNGGTYLGPTLCDVDSPPCRHRLWLWGDSIIPYHITHFSETRGRRKEDGWDELRSPATAHDSGVRAHVR
jgi:hypothetical protein